MTRHQACAVGVDDAARRRGGAGRRGADGAEVAVQRNGLAGASARRLPAPGIEPGQALGRGCARAGVGGRDQAAIGQPHADVAGAGVHVAAPEQAAAHTADLRPGLPFVAVRRFRALVHAGNRANAVRKKSLRPKLPDLSAMCRPSGARGDRAWHQGTPGSICAPMRNCAMPRACTQAPEVSPPATISWRTPRCTRAHAIAASVASTSAPAWSLPKRPWMARTADGSALEYSSTGPWAICASAQARASATMSMPEAMRSGSMASAGLPAAMKSITCWLVATEQLPDTMA